MDLKEYTTTNEKDKIENKSKKVISEDAFAIADLINQLIKKIEQTRVLVR